MVQQNNGKKRSALSDAVFPSTVPLAMRILSVIAAAVLLTAGALFASGYFSEENEPEDLTYSPLPTVTDGAELPEESTLPQTDAPVLTDIPSSPSEPDPAGLTLCGGSGTIYSGGEAIVLHVGDSASLELLAGGEPVSAEAITWKSFDEAVVSVDGGTLTALSVGETQCRATYSSNNRSISITVTVKETETAPPASSAPKPSGPPASTATPAPTITPVEPPAPTETPTPTPGKLPFTPTNPFPSTPAPGDGTGEAP